MTIKEAYEEWFLKPVAEYIKSEPQELIDFLQGSKKIKIEERYFDYDAVDKRIADPNYLSVPVEIQSDKLILNDITPEIKDVIVKHLSKDITELELSSKFLEDITFLKEFPNLKTLRILGLCKFSEEEIAFVKENTNITEIQSENGIIIPYDYFPKPGEIYLKQPSAVFISGNLTCRSINCRNTGRTVEGIVGDPTLDLSLLERAYSLTEKNPNKQFTEVEIQSSALSKQPYSRRHILKVIINSNHEIEKVIYNGRKDISKLSEVIKKLEQVGPIKNILLNCENRDYDKIYYLNPIAKKYNLMVNYWELIDCTLEEFLAMRESINWFNDLVRQYDLSPAEIVTYAYDIMKTFAYKENEEEKEIPRYIHSIVASNYIVCVGYSKFLTQILKENGIKATEVSVTCNIGAKEPEGHSKTLVRIDDDKYDIHGVYCIDATWDRSRGKAILVETKDGKNYVQYDTNEGDTIKREFDPLGLYRNYLVPAADYPKIYPDDSQPQLFKVTNEGELTNLINPTTETADKYLMGISQLISLFGINLDKDTIVDYMSAKKPSLEVLRNILFNVRRAQGYSTEEALKNVEDNINLNQMIDEYNRKEPTFFQSSHRR